MTEEVKNNRALFRKIVRKHNEKYGYNFVLPKDTDYTSTYAHPVHEEDGLRITSQIDDTNDTVYAIRLTIDGVSFETSYSKELTYDEIKKVISSDQFKQRLATLQQLRKLRDELNDHIQSIDGQLVEDSLTDIEKDEAYDLTTRTARAIYKGNI